jgi:hypothetical protein
MSTWPGYAGAEGEGYFDGELEEIYLFTQVAVNSGISFYAIS